MAKIIIDVFRAGELLLSREVDVPTAVSPADAWEATMSVKELLAADGWSEDDIDDCELTIRDYRSLR